VNDREFRKHLIELRLERERKEAQAANAAVKKPPARALEAEVGGILFGSSGGT
jgi:hypothetical protein